MSRVFEGEGRTGGVEWGVVVDSEEEATKAGRAFSPAAAACRSDQRREPRSPSRTLIRAAARGPRRVARAAQQSLSRRISVVAFAACRQCCRADEAIAVRCLASLPPRRRPSVPSPARPCASPSAALVISAGWARGSESRGSRQHARLAAREAEGAGGRPPCLSLQCRCSPRPLALTVRRARVRGQQGSLALGPRQQAGTSRGALGVRAMGMAFIPRAQGARRPGSPGRRACRRTSGRPRARRPRAG